MKKILTFTALFSLLTFYGISLERDQIKYWNEADSYLMKEKTDGSLLVLDDGSAWTIGYWYESTVSNWNEGDMIQFQTPYDLAYYFYQIDNLTTGETAWSTGEKIKPDSNYLGCKWIHDIYKNDAGLQIKTNQDIIFSFSPSQQKYTLDWREGDVLTFIRASWPDGSPAVINQTRNPLLILPIIFEDK